MRTFGFLLLLIVFIVVLSNIAAIANKSNGFPDLSSVIFPEKFVDKEEEQARNTGQAPFAAEENAARPEDIRPDIKYDPLVDNINVTESLDIQHRHEAAVNKWVTEAVSEVLNFTLDGYENHKKTKLAELMDANAFREFEAFLQSAHIRDYMATNNNELKAFVADTAAMRASGATGGRFHWVYDLPVTLTFLPIGVRDYAKIKESDYRSEKTTIRVQIGRVPAGGRDGIIIETWEIAGAAK